MEEQTIDCKHRKFVDGLQRLRGRWGLRQGDYATPDPGAEVSAHFELGDLLPDAINGFVNYRFRRLLRDDSNCDDYVDFEFESEQVDVHELAHVTMPAYVECFDPYHGYICHEEFIYIDFDRSRFFNERNDVLRIHPVNFFDDELCRRAFGMTAESVVSRLSNIVERADVFHGGALIIVNSTPVSIEEAAEIDGRIRPLLKDTGN